MTDLSCSLSAIQSRLLGFKYIMCGYFSLLDRVQLHRRHPDWLLALRRVESFPQRHVAVLRTTSYTTSSLEPSVLPADWCQQAGA